MVNKTKILIVRLSAIGDVVHVLPAMRALRASFPDAYIGWLVEDRVKDLIIGHPDLNEVVFFPRKKWTQGLLNPLSFFKTVREIIHFFRQLRGWKYDIAIDFQGNLRSGVLTFLSGAQKRIGFGRGYCKEFSYLFTNCHVYLDNRKLHKIDKDLALLRPLNIQYNGQKVDIPISSPDREYISGFLRNNNIADRPTVVVHPGTSEFGSYKRWDEENYARLGDMLVNEWNANVIFTWHGSEYDTVKKIVSLMTRKGIVSCETSIKQLVELIRLADLFIGGDTGPMQIASILGTPLVAIFGPKDPTIYGPRSANSVVVRKDVPCSPCEKRTCNQPICMELIRPEDVFRAASVIYEKVG
ncbi:MAG: glycosyltransferase family 9 protein, partial [Planctomycetes bacterium]|nr:glycosyltransferase family 9 protein [Planctomycetota bacterium]